MSYIIQLTEKENSNFIEYNSFKRNKSLKMHSYFYELEDNYYENLFLKESEFKINPKKENISLIIQNYCKAVEYFSEKDDNEKIVEYKILIDIFLNSPNALNLLDNKDKENFNYVKKILILNKYKKLNNMIEEDDIRFHSENIINLFNKKERDKLNKLILKNGIKKRDSVNLINDDIKNQQNTFQQKLLSKKNSLIRKEKNINENRLLQSIQNASINNKKKGNNKINMGQNNTKNIEKLISPIKNELNYESKKNISININSFSYSNKTNEKENNSMLNIIINKKNTSNFEPFTPENNSKLNKSNNKSSLTNKLQCNSVEIIETNDFTLNNDNCSLSDSNNKLQNELLLKENDICLDKTKESSNFSNISNLSKISESLNSSSFINIIFKNFRLDFKDLFKHMKDSNITNKKKLFCKDIKIILENYIKDFNQYINENIFMKFAKNYFNLWDDIFNEYVNISYIYDKELEKIDEKINDYMNDEFEKKKFQKSSENLRIERDNEINKSEESFNSKIESISFEFKYNYNNIDKCILLLNERFSFVILNRIFDLINNNE